MIQSDKEMVAYGVSLREIYPNITEEQLRAALEARFIGGKDVLVLCQTGCICNPLNDFVALLTIVVNSVRKIFIQKTEAFEKVQMQINNAVEDLMSMK